MNKKLFLGMFAAVGMLLATSCMNDELDLVQSGDEAQVTFSLGLEGGISTRAISDGTKADKLVYAVYKLNANGEPELQNVVGTTNGQFVKTDFKSGDNVSITLAKGQTYQVAFWAQDEDCKAYDTDDLTAVEVKYKNEDGTDAANNDELRDAFFKTVEFEVAGDKSIDVVMKRPFAQINVGVDAEDWDAAVASGIEIKKSAVVVKNAANTINLLTGAISGEQDVTYTINAIPAEDLMVDADGDGTKEAYHWLSMSYILVNDTHDVDEDTDGTIGDYRTNLESLEYTFTPASGNAIEFAEGLNNVPVQRNWRTNILGKILTGDIQFNITIDPAYDDDINVNAPNTTAVSTSDGLKAAFAKGGNVVLENDIKLEEVLNVAENANVNLDMNGKTITLEGTSVDPAFYTSKGSTLTITGNGTVEINDPSVSLIFPGGDVVIENGTFVRNIPAGTPANQVGAFFVGAKVSPWGSQTVTIKGGYFDGGYYNADAADIDDILAGTKEFTETADDIAKRDNSKDANKVRVAIKQNVQLLLNLSYNLFKVYGGTFVGANPAWGDEGCMLPTTPNYLRPWSYYQGALLEGQTFNENGLVIPTGYEITKGATADGRPTYTVTYNK